MTLWSEWSTAYEKKLSFHCLRTVYGKKKPVSIWSNIQTNNQVSDFQEGKDVSRGQISILPRCDEQLWFQIFDQVRLHETEISTGFAADAGTWWEKRHRYPSFHRNYAFLIPYGSFDLKIQMQEISGLQMEYRAIQESNKPRRLKYFGRHTLQCRFLKTRIIRSGVELEIIIDIFWRLISCRQPFLVRLVRTVMDVFGWTKFGLFGLHRQSYSRAFVARKIWHDRGTDNNLEAAQEKQVTLYDHCASNADQ